MLAIAQRGSLSEAVTDVLVELGDREVVLNAVDNYGASFSDHGFTVLVSRSEGDDLLAEMVGSRSEIPSPLLTALVAKASSASARNWKPPIRGRKRPYIGPSLRRQAVSRRKWLQRHSTIRRP